MIYASEMRNKQHLYKKAIIDEFLKDENVKNLCVYLMNEIKIKITKPGSENNIDFYFQNENIKLLINKISDKNIIDKLYDFFTYYGYKMELDLFNSMITISW